MKLDENVCRGTLLIHKAEKLVVLGPGVHIKRFGESHWNPRGHEGQTFGWRVMATECFESGSIVVDSFRTVSKDEEVEMFFPGVAFDLPDYIK